MPLPCHLMLLFAVIWCSFVNESNIVKHPWEFEIWQGNKRCLKQIKIRADSFHCFLAFHRENNELINWKKLICCSPKIINHSCRCFYTAPPRAVFSCAQSTICLPLTFFFPWKQENVLHTTEQELSFSGTSAFVGLICRAVRRSCNSLSSAALFSFHSRINHHFSPWVKTHSLWGHPDGFCWVFSLNHIVSFLGVCSCRSRCPKRLWAGQSFACCGSSWRSWRGGSADGLRGWWML